MTRPNARQDDDRLALATRTRKARRGGTCTICRAPVIVGQPIARLASPPGWCHVRCVPHVARVLGTSTAPGQESTP